MGNKLRYLLFFLLVIFGSQCAAAKKIHNRQFRFKLTLPSTMTEVKDSLGAGQGQLYFDTTVGIVLMFSARESKFRSVKDYLDCTKEELETQLRANFGDPSLRLISCNQSAYYPQKATVLNFQVSILPFGYNSYIIYFFHHRHKDIQISFTFKKDMGPYSIEYIDSIMKTFKLR